MSETKPASDLDSTIKDLAEQAPTIKPIVEMQGKILGRVETVAADAESAREKTIKRVDEFQEKVEKGFADAAERMDRMSERFSAMPTIGGGFNDRTKAMRDVASKEAKAMAPRLKSFARETFKDGEYLSDELVAANLEEWFRLSTILQRRSFSAHHRQAGERLDKLNKAFSDMLDPVRDADMAEVQKAALEGGTAAEGGNLIPTIVEPEIMRLVKDAGDIFPRCRQVMMTSLTHNIPDEATAVTVNWVDEEGALTQGEPTFGQKTLTALKLAGRARMSEEVVQDASTPILPYLLTVFTEGMAGELDAQIVDGTGSSPAITGLVTAASVNEVQADGAGSAGAALAWSGNGIVETYVAAGESSARGADSFWISGPALWGKLLGLADSQGLPIYQTGALHLAGRRQLLGHDIVVSNRVDEEITVGADTTGNLYFGPGSKLVFGTRMGMRWDVTDQVGWANFQMDARLVGRFAFVVGVPAAWSKLTGVHSD